MAVSSRRVGPGEMTESSVEGGQDDDTALSSSLNQTARSGQAVQAGHLDVQEQHVHRVALRPPQGLVSIGGLPNHLHVGLGTQEHGQPRGQQRLVIGQADADHAHMLTHPLYSQRPPARS